MNNGQVSINTDAHDEVNADVEVTGEEKALYFADSITKSPDPSSRIVVDKKRKSEGIKDVTDDQVAGEHHSRVPVLLLLSHKQPQCQYVPHQCHTHLHTVDGR
ncbi:hypothetical protein PDJAM_G00137900 [Pangasius djambal]|uniref:Uncharacterized protein n=1 Tax=Pangasius djambal TaxID=1691987 RepID=A0ACC5ZD62_9TELE|nr:hypothetical protein [Pangasius djambal]